MGQGRAAELPTAPGVPELDDAAACADGERAVAREGERADPVGGPQRPLDAPAAHVEQEDARADRDGEQRAVGREGDRAGRRLQDARPPQQPAARDVPDRDTARRHGLQRGVADVARGEEPAVGREGDGLRRLERNAL